MNEREIDESVKKVALVRKTVSVNFYRCPVCGDEGTVIGETFSCHLAHHPEYEVEFD